MDGTLFCCLRNVEGGVVWLNIRRPTADLRMDLLYHYK